MLRSTRPESDGDEAHMVGNKRVLRRPKGLLDDCHESQDLRTDRVCVKRRHSSPGSHIILRHIATVPSATDVRMLRFHTVATTGVSQHHDLKVKKWRYSHINRKAMSLMTVSRNTANIGWKKKIAMQLQLRCCGSNGCWKGGAESQRARPEPLDIDVARRWREYRKVCDSDLPSPPLSTVR